jgi:1,4-dihydroxy-2-naphthoate octaprenyltransferase
VNAVPVAGRQRPGSTAGLWWMGARPRTLGVGVVPVLVGAAASSHPRLLPTIGALVVAASLQVGANYANDYFDGVRGVDTGERLGPTRLTASGLVPARAVLAAGAGCLFLAAVVGAWLALATGVGWLILLGAAALGAALLYTGGPRPYAATGVVADLAVFGFFGLMAVVGTVAVQGAGVATEDWWAGAVMGLLAVSVLEANNLRDAVTDAAAGRHTLVVRLGDRTARVAYQVLVAAAGLVPLIGVALRQLPVPSLLILLALPGLLAPLRLVRDRSRAGRGLAPLLPLTARFHLVAGVLLALGLGVAGPGRLSGVVLALVIIVAVLLGAGLAGADLRPRRA